LAVPSSPSLTAAWWSATGPTRGADRADRPSTRRSCPRSPPRPGEPPVGLPAHPGRARWPRLWGVRHLDPAGCWPEAAWIRPDGASG
jgi:hypothetical protein